MSKARSIKRQIKCGCLTALDSVYQYEATVLENCDTDRNAEHRTHIQAEIEALIHEHLENAS